MIDPGFDSPVGTDKERASEKIWPGYWVDVNPFANKYTNPSTGNISYHTGADLNLNKPFWDADRGARVSAVASGKVVVADSYRIWGNIIVVGHKMEDGTMVYSRYGHIHEMSVSAGDEVSRGQQIAIVGQDALGGPYHLHFDISYTNVLVATPWDWPGKDLEKLKRNYLDPKKFIIANRPKRGGRKTISIQVPPGTTEIVMEFLP